MTKATSTQKHLYSTIVLPPQRNGQFGCSLFVTFLLSLIPYCTIGTFQFVNWDDNIYVVNRPEIQNGLTWEGIAWAFTTFSNSNWHPLTWLSYMLEIELFGLDSGVMHLTNLALHGLNTVLVGLLIQKLTESESLAIGVALFFGIHPQHVETVAWVSERKELLGVFFGLQSMVLWQEYVIGRKLRYWFMAHLLFLFSLLSKQMLITLPFLLIVLEICPLKSDAPEITWNRVFSAIRSVWCFFALTIFFTVAVFLAQSSGESIVSRHILPFWVRLANSIQSIAFYFFQTLVPVGLNPFYRHPLSNISLELTAICAAALLAGVRFLWKNRNQPGILAGALWFVGTLVPVIGIVQLGSAARADRYVYFPHIGLFLLLGSLPVIQRHQHIKTVLSALAAIAVTFSLLTYRQATIWRNGVSLWSACLVVDPDSYRGHDSLALALLADERIPEALREAEIAIQYPENAFEGTSYTTLGCAQMFSGNTSDATKNLRKAIELRPDDYRALINLGYALHDSDLMQAKQMFSRALEYDPASVEAIGNLANCEAEEGNFSRALELLQQAMEINPNEPRLKENFRLYQEAQKQLQ